MTDEDENGVWTGTMRPLELVVDGIIKHKDVVNA